MVSSMILLFGDLWVTLMQMCTSYVEVSITPCLELNELEHVVQAKNFFEVELATKERSMQSNTKK